LTYFGTMTPVCTETPHSASNPEHGVQGHPGQRDGQRHDDGDAARYFTAM